MTIDFWLKLAPVIVSLAALYQTYFGPRRTTLHSQRIQLTNALLKSSSEYGWKLGALNGPDRSLISAKELHEDPYEEIVRLYNRVVVDLEMLETVMPDRWLTLLQDCQQKLKSLHTTFYTGKFSRQQDDFIVYYKSITNLRNKLRGFLAKGFY